jgi:hypothetical protein
MVWNQFSEAVADAQRSIRVSKEPHAHVHRLSTSYKQQALYELAFRLHEEERRKQAEACIAKMINILEAHDLEVPDV